MKKALAFAIGALTSAAAFAGPAIQLPGGPLYLKFSGQEQIAVNGATTCPAGWNCENEINWGVFAIDTISNGVVTTPGSQIGKDGSPFFVDSSKAQITGIFYGVRNGENPSLQNQLPGASGYLDLYWRDIESGLDYTNVSSIGPDIRTDVDQATGITDGEFLVRLKFDSGIDPNSSVNTISGSSLPTSQGFNGLAESFASVDTSAVGLWTEKLDTNWFNTPFGQRDLRFKNSYSANLTWNGGPNVFGAQIDDPAQAVALPEPGALSLMGLAMIGMGAVLRRRQKNAK